MPPPPTTSATTSSPSRSRTAPTPTRSSPSAATTWPTSSASAATRRTPSRRPRSREPASPSKRPSTPEKVPRQLWRDELAKRNRYEFNLTWRHSRLRPLRLVTLTEPALDLQRTPVRILSVEEGDDRRVSIVAE